MQGAGGKNCAKARELAMCDYPEAVMGVTGPSVHGAPDVVGKPPGRFCWIEETSRLWQEV